jgi:hypothetical protein
MFRLNFTSKVLGEIAAQRLRERGITQTLRSPSSGIVGELINNRLSVGSAVEVALDGEPVGEAVLTWCDRLYGDRISIDDAKLGGFGTIAEFEKCLKRAGYRFKSIDKYNFYRIRFRWAEGK